MNVCFAVPHTHVPASVRVSEPSLSILPSTTQRTVLPAASFDSTSKWTVQSLGFSFAFCSAMCSKPGLTSPVTCVPSQSMISVTSVRVFAFGPLSPCHEPTSGWPSCAAAGAVPARHSNAIARQNLCICIVPAGHGAPCPYISSRSRRREQRLVIAVVLADEFEDLFHRRHVQPIGSALRP